MATTKKEQEVNIETQEILTDEVITQELQRIEAEAGKYPPIPQQQSVADNFLLTIQRAASDPTVDMDKMKELYAMAKDVKHEEAKLIFHREMALCQGEMPVIPKIHHNKQTDSMYAKFEDIIRIIKPIYSKHGFSVSLYSMEAEPGWIKVGCDVSNSGFTLHSEDIAPIDDVGIKGTVNKTQIHGRESAKSYLKRSLVSSAFALEIGGTDTDDDGNAAGSGEIIYVNDEQIAELETMVKEGGLDEEATLAYIESKTGTPAYASIKAPDFAAIKVILAKKIAAHKKVTEGKE